MICYKMKIVRADCYQMRAFDTYKLWGLKWRTKLMLISALKNNCGIFLQLLLNSMLRSRLTSLKRRMRLEENWGQLGMNYNLPPRVEREIIVFAKKHDVKKVVLFGSRARRTNTERSDIDIAVYGGDFDAFYFDIKEKINSLLMFDIVEADKKISDELQNEIRKDGVVIYEKA